MLVQSTSLRLGFQAQESVPRGNADQPVHTPHQQNLGSSRK